MDPLSDIPAPASDPLLSELKISGRLARLGKLRSEWYNEIVAPESVIARLKAGRVPMDVFTFIQRIPDVVPRFPYHYEMDHMAAVPITTFEHWWENQVIKKVRKNIRRSEKAGVTVAAVPFDDRLIRAIQRIYSETPIRSGRPFKHYQDDFETCKRKHQSYADRSEFIAAFYQGEIIGFIKMVYAGRTARTMQNISLEQYRDFSVSNALIAHAVKICAHRGITHLVYGKLAYGKKGSDGLEEFKLSNGFIRMEFPRYYVPITRRGEWIVRLRLYRDITDLSPKALVKLARRMRTNWYELRTRHVRTAPAMSRPRSASRPPSGGR